MRGMLVSGAPDRGITVTAIAAMDEPIDVNPETIVAFVGRAPCGPLNTPLLLNDIGEFRRRFGDVDWQPGLGPAVREFFEHGGRQLYVVRVANDARGAMICLPAAGSALVLRAVEPGASAAIRVAVDYDGVSTEERFNLTLQRIDDSSGHVLDQEYYEGLSYCQDDGSFVGSALATSGMARVEGPLPSSRPHATVGPEFGIGVEYVEACQPGSDGAPLTDYDLVGSRAAETGIFALAGIERLDILYMPPLARDVDIGPTAVLVAERYCRERGALLVTDPRAEWTTLDDAIAGIREFGYASANMLSYFPRALDPDSGDHRPEPVGGAVAGLLARLDRTHGRWSSLDSQCLCLKGKRIPAIRIDPEDQPRLQRSGLNYFTADGAKRLRLTGDRTLARGSDPHFRCTELPVRRLCLAIVQAVDAATRWAVFERPGQRLSVKVETQIRACLAALVDCGALADPDYRVSCRAEPATAERRGRVDVTLSFTPLSCRHPIQLTVHQAGAACGPDLGANPPGRDPDGSLDALALLIPA